MVWSNIKFGGIIVSEERHLFIADLHFGDDPVRRGHRKEFASDEEHNNFIHNNINGF